MITTAKGITSAYAPMGARDRHRPRGRAVHGGHRRCSPTASRSAGTRWRPRWRWPTSTSSSARTSAATCARRRASSAQMLDGHATTCRSSATCAAPASSTRSSWSRTRRRRRRFDDEESEELLRGFMSGELYRRGLICRADDRGDPVIQLSPPLIADTEQFEEIDIDPARGAHRGLGADRRGAEPAGAGPMLTVRGLVDGDGARARGRRGRRGRARPLGAHLGAARPHAVALGRRAAAHHRDPARHAERQREFVRRLSGHHLAGLGFGTGFDHAELPEATRSMRRDGSTSRCSRCRTSCRSSRSPRAFARLVNEQYEVLQRGIAIHKRLERLVLEERGLDEVVRALAAATGGAVCVLVGRGETIASRRSGARFPPPRWSRCATRCGAAARHARLGARRVRARPPGDRRPLARAAGVHPRARRAPGLAGGGARHRRPRRLRAADPPAGRDGGGARADAPARDARHRAPPGGRRARRGAHRAAVGGRAAHAPAAVRRGRDAAVLVFAGGDGRPPPAAAASSTVPRGRRRRARWWRRASGCCARSSTRREGVDPVALAGRARDALAAEHGDAARRRRRGPRPSARCGAASTRRAARSRRRRSSTARRRPWPPTATSARSSCCCRSRTTRRCASTATACSGPLEDASGEYGDELIRSLEASSSRTASGSARRASSTATGTRCATGSGGWSSSRARPVDGAGPNRVLARAAGTRART